MNILEEVISVISEVTKIPAERFSANSDMSEFQEWDSVRHVMILSAMEEHFNVMFPEDDIFDLTSVQAFVDEIEKLKKG